MMPNNIKITVGKNLQKFVAMATFLSLPLLHQAQSKADTAIVNFGNSSKIVFHINEQEDLERLKSYDLNALVIDMKDKIEADTVVHPEKGRSNPKDSIVVIELTKEDLTSDSDDHRSSSHRKRRLTEKKVGKNHFINFDFGINNYVEDGKSPNSNNAQYAVKPWGSWYVAINSVHKNNLAGPVSLHWGGGISWYNFKFEDASTRLVKTDRQLKFVSSPEDANFKKSKLTAFFINLNFVPVLDLSTKKVEKLRVGLGGYFGYRLASHAKYTLKLDKTRRKDKNKDSFYLNDWRYGVRLQIGYRDFDVFFNYDTSKLFAGNNNPSLNAFSFGITI